MHAPAAMIHGPQLKVARYQAPIPSPADRNAHALKKRCPHPADQDGDDAHRARPCQQQQIAVGGPHRCASGNAFAISPTTRAAVSAHAVVPPLAYCLTASPTFHGGVPIACRQRRIEPARGMPASVRHTIEERLENTGKSTSLFKTLLPIIF